MPADRSSTLSLEMAARWRLFWVLVAAGVLASFAIAPFQAQILTQVKAKRPVPAQELITYSMFESLLLASVATALGIRFGPRAGTGAPWVRSMLDRKPVDWPAARAGLFMGLKAGALCGIALLIVEPVLDAVLPVIGNDIRHPTLGASVLAAFGAGVFEEIVFRFGIMTALIVLLMKLARTRTATPTVMWSANILAALAFAFSHVPIALAVGTMSPALVFSTVIPNAVVGVVFGWLFVRYGLTSAIVGHVLTDLLLHGVSSLMR